MRRSVRLSGTDRLLLLLPAVMAAHNLEEYLGMERYARRRGLAVSHRQVQIALGLATALPAILAGLAVCSRPHSRRKLAGLALAGLMLANTLSHVGQTLVFREPSPGIYTALGLVLPIGLQLGRQAVREGYLLPHERFLVMGLGAVAMPPAALLLQGLGWLADRMLGA